MNCAEAICSIGDADWYLDLTGWHLPALIAAIVTALALLAVRAVTRRAHQWQPPTPTRTAVTRSAWSRARTRPTPDRRPQP